MGELHRKLSGVHGYLGIHRQGSKVSKGDEETGGDVSPVGEGSTVADRHFDGPQRQISLCSAYSDHIGCCGFPYRARRLPSQRSSYLPNASVRKMTSLPSSKKQRIMEAAAAAVS